MSITCKPHLQIRTIVQISTKYYTTNICRVDTIGIKTNGNLSHLAQGSIRHLYLQVFIIMKFFKCITK